MNGFLNTPAPEAAVFSEVVPPADSLVIRVQ
jgi:hypothetical protein